MKKLILLLFLPLWVLAQTSTGQEQEFDYGIKNNAAQTVTSPAYLTTTGTDGTQGKVVSVMNQNANSGILYFDGLAVNADPTKFNLGYGDGYVVNSLTGTVSHISWGTQSALTTPYRTTSVATYVLMADAGGGFGTLVLQNTAPTQQQFRTHIYLGKLAHTTFGNILFAVTEPSRMFDTAGQISDLNRFLGSGNVDGNVITYNGANMNINCSAGMTYRPGANYLTDRNSPSITTEPSFTAGTFRNKFRNGSGGWTAVNTTTVDNNHWDNGSGILQVVPNNKWTIMVFWRFGGTGTIHCDYGQAIYDNKVDALLAAGKIAVAEDPENKRDASRRAWLVVKQGVTVLNNIDIAEFLNADKFGERSAGNSSTGTLQTAYNNSVTPQITTTTGGGAVAIKRGSATDTDNVLVVQNGSGSNTFSVTGAGNIIGGTYNGYTPVSGTGTATYLPKWSNTTSLANSLIFDDGTKIGIGTSLPSRKLSVNGDLGVKEVVLINGVSNSLLLMNNDVSSNTWSFTSRDDGYFTFGRFGVGNDMYFEDNGKAHFTQGIGVGGNSIFTGTITANAATTDNEVVIKSQLDAVPKLNSFDFGKSDLGNVDVQDLNTDYVHIISYGQSLSTGTDNATAFTTTAIDGNYMIGTSVDDHVGSTKTALVNTDKEHFIVPTVNSFSKLYRRYVDRNQEFIASSSGLGGRTILKLSKAGQPYADGTYEDNFIADITKAKAVADGESKTISCPAIFFLQGESDYDDVGTNPSSANGNKSAYKTRLLQLKNDMQADVMSIYGQESKPMFFICPPGGDFAKNKDMGINMAMMEFAEENEDVILLNPNYFTPDYEGTHLSINGYRWYGEQCAKTLYKAVVKGERFQAVYPKKYEIVGKKINIYFHVPVAPLVFDSKIIATLPKKGFYVVQDGSPLTISTVTLAENCVTLTMPNTLSGTVEIGYASTFGEGGLGNLRDSDNFKSNYLYEDDTLDYSKSARDGYWEFHTFESGHPDYIPGHTYAINEYVVFHRIDGDILFKSLVNGNNTIPAYKIAYRPLSQDGSTLIGKKYPMYNWANHFYTSINLSE